MVASCLAFVYLSPKNQNDHIMRKIWVLIALFGLSGCMESRAQAQKGTTYWGGTIRLEGTLRGGKDNDYRNKYNNMQHYVTPEIQWGKFVNPTTMMGLGLAYSLGWTNNSSTVLATDETRKNRSVSQSVAILPFVRKYKFFNERWAVFLHGEVGPTFGWRSSKSEGTNIDNYKQNLDSYGLRVKPGLVYSFPGKRLSIEGYADILSLGVNYSPFRKEDNQPASFKFFNRPLDRISKFIPNQAG